MKVDQIKALGVATLAMFTLPALNGCSSSPDFAQETKPTSTTPLSITKAERLQAIRDVGNGVFVFPVSNFAETLSDFKEANPNIKVTGITSVDTASYGTTANFVVNTEQK